LIWFVLEFDNAEVAEQAVDVLRKRHHVTGEMALRPLDDGKWRLTVNSEKNLKPATLEKLGGEVVSLS